jgi:hypothetical protein
MKAITALGCHWAKWGVTRFMGALEADMVQYTDPDVYIALDESTVETWLNLYPAARHTMLKNEHHHQFAELLSVAIGQVWSLTLNGCTIWIGTKEVTPEIKGGYIEARRQDNEYVAV